MLLKAKLEHFLDECSDKNSPSTADMADMVDRVFADLKQIQVCLKQNLEESQRLIIKYRTSHLS
jgi:hypothetical protein